MITKAARILIATITVLLSASTATMRAQQPAAPAAPATPAASRPPRAPRPDKAFELHAIAPEFWKLFDKDAKLQTMGTGFRFTEGPVWDPAGFLWVSDEEKNKIVKPRGADGHTEDVVSLVDPDGSTFTTSSIGCSKYSQRVARDYSPLRRRQELRNRRRSLPAGKRPPTTPNDIVIGPDGAIYFTDPIIRI